MTRRTYPWMLGMAALLVISVPPTVTARAPFRHIVLDRSVPNDGEKVSGQVSEIRLFFSDAPLMRGASVRVVTSGRSLQRSTPPTPDPDDSKQVFVQMTPPLQPGAYVVQWRCIADDGHVMRGDFTFEVVAE